MDENNEEVTLAYIKLKHDIKETIREAVQELVVETLNNPIYYGEVYGLRESVTRDAVARIIHKLQTQLQVTAHAI